jgi:hypothetical protein
MIDYSYANAPVQKELSAGLSLSLSLYMLHLKHIFIVYANTSFENLDIVW